jgi:hypothetical protein
MRNILVTMVNTRPTIFPKPPLNVSNAPLVSSVTVVPNPMVSAHKHSLNAQQEATAQRQVTRLLQPLSRTVELALSALKELQLKFPADQVTPVLVRLCLKWTTL